MEQGQKWHLASRLPYNIGRKAFPNSFGQGTEASAVVRHLACRLNKKVVKDVLLTFDIIFRYCRLLHERLGSEPDHSCTQLWQYLHAS